jgi:hypothetical protein
VPSKVENLPLAAAPFAAKVQLEDGHLMLHGGRFPAPPSRPLDDDAGAVSRSGASLVVCCAFAA